MKRARVALEKGPKLHIPEEQLFCGHGEPNSMMRLSREKIVRLSHQITEVLVASEEVEFVDDRDTIRQQIVQILTAMLRDEEKIELEVRKRITSQKKEILEGSEEWDVLHRKYYQDELRRMGIAAAPDDRRRS
jgi:hypothetical protein